MGRDGEEVVEIERSRSRSWKNFGCRWTSGLRVLKNFQFSWTSHVYNPRAGMNVLSYRTSVLKGNFANIQDETQTLLLRVDTLITKLDLTSPVDVG